MAKVLPFFSLNEKNKPSSERVYHNEDTCPVARKIPPDQRHAGSAGYALCDACYRLDPFFQSRGKPPGTGTPPPRK